jgi:hypothetical protein
MIQTCETYTVTVGLNDGQTMVCTLLSKPTVEALAAVAESQGLPADFGKVLLVLGSVEVPESETERTENAIQVAGVELGRIVIERGTAYAAAKKGRKKSKPADEPAAPRRRRRGQQDAPPADTEPESAVAAPADSSEGDS